MYYASVNTYKNDKYFQDPKATLFRDRGFEKSSLPIVDILFALKQ